MNKCFITSFDTYGKQFQFNIEGGTFKTLFGGILSIIMGLATVGLFGYFGIDLYLKENPMVLEKLDYLDYSPLNEKHNRSNTFVAFRFKGPYSDDVRYFEHYVIHYHKYANKSGNIVSDNIYGLTHKCTTDDDIDEDTFERDKLSEYFCYDQTDLMFGGPDINSISHFPALTIKYCGADTEKRYNITCCCTFMC